MTLTNLTAVSAQQTVTWTFQNPLIKKYIYIRKSVEEEIPQKRKWQYSSVKKRNKDRNVFTKIS